MCGSRPRSPAPWQQSIDARGLGTSFVRPIILGQNGRRRRIERRRQFTRRKHQPLVGRQIAAILLEIAGEAMLAIGRLCRADEAEARVAE